MALTILGLGKSSQLGCDILRLLRTEHASMDRMLIWLGLSFASLSSFKLTLAGFPSEWRNSGCDWGLLVPLQLCWFQVSVVFQCTVQPGAVSHPGLILSVALELPPDVKEPPPAELSASVLHNTNAVLCKLGLMLMVFPWECTPNLLKNICGM